MQEVIQKYKDKLSDLLACKSSEIKIYLKEPNEEQREVGRVALGRYTLKHKNKTVASWRLIKMPYCGAYMVSCDASVSEEYRNKGIGSLLNLLRQDIGRELNFVAILCTHIEQNPHQKQILSKNGFKNIHTTTNKNTGNLLHLAVIDL